LGAAEEEDDIKDQFSGGEDPERQRGGGTSTSRSASS